MQQFAKRAFNIGYLLIGISAFCSIIAKPLKKKEIEQLIKTHKFPYVSYISSLADKWYWYQALGPVSKYGARVKYTKSELEYAEAAGPFFENKMRVEQEARAIGTQDHDIEYLRNLINCYKQQGSQEKDLPRILHEKNIEDLSLSPEINREILKRNPAKLSDWVKNGRISNQQYCRNVALNIFMKFLVDNRLLS
ncbi:MAG: hypothetical protein WCD44_01655 [Candidatus Babeliales bacterium]